MNGVEKGEGMMEVVKNKEEKKKKEKKDRAIGEYLYLSDTLDRRGQGREWGQRGFSAHESGAIDGHCENAKWCDSVGLIVIAGFLAVCVVRYGALDLSFAFVCCGFPGLSHFLLSFSLLPRWPTTPIAPPHTHTLFQPLCHSATLSLLTLLLCYPNCRLAFFVIQWINGCPLEPFSVTDPTMFRNKFFFVIHLASRLTLIFFLFSSWVGCKSEASSNWTAIPRYTLPLCIFSSELGFFFSCFFSSFLRSTLPWLGQT